MSFLSRRRSVDPVNSHSTSSPGSSKQKEKALRSKQSLNDLSNTPRNRSGSDASVFRRVSTIFAARRRTSSKPSPSSQGHYNGSAGIGYIRTNGFATLPRLSSDSTPPSSPEIRRPSGLGRRASIMEASYMDSTGSVTVSEGYQGGEGDNMALGGFTSLPNLLGGGGFRLNEIPSEITSSHPDPDADPELAAELESQLAPRTHGFALPDQLLQIVFEFLPTHDLTVAALVSREFCSAVQHALYHSLDAGSFTEPQVGQLVGTLARKQELADLVFSFDCPSWPTSSDRNTTPVPPDDFLLALHNMRNLKILYIHSFASILSRTPSPTFSLTHLTILDEKMTHSQLTDIRRWLTTQSSLQSLSFPKLVEYESGDAASPATDDWIPVVVPPSNDGEDASCIAPLPALESLHVPSQIVGTLCSSLQHRIHRLTLDVHRTLYSGLRPSSILRPFKGVSEMTIVFAPEVDKRTVEKFLVVTGSVLSGECDPDGLKSLEIEVLWTDKNAAETLYRIVTAIIYRFKGLQKLKLISPFRSIQTPTPAPAITLSLLPLPSPLPSPTRSVFSAHSSHSARSAHSGRSALSAHSSSPSIYASTLQASTPHGGTLQSATIEREFVACGIEKGYAKTWTKSCPSLEDVQFDFSCSVMETEVELCGVWFRRKVGGKKRR